MLYPWIQDNKPARLLDRDHEETRGGGNHASANRTDASAELHAWSRKRSSHAYKSTSFRTSLNVCPEDD